MHRHTARQQLDSLVEGAKLLWQYHGDRQAVAEHLERDREWAHFAARHGLEPSQLPPGR